MAHMEPYTRKQIGKIANEAYRKHKSEKAYKNNVDLSKSHLNYSMNNLDREGFLYALDKRVLEVMQERTVQSQTKLACNWVATCPEELRGDPKKEKRYFEVFKEFCESRYGKENVIDVVVHNDETNPHAVACVCPVGISRKTGLLSVSKASVITKTDLDTWHEDFDAALEREFGIAGLGLNGRTKGGYTLAELKERTKRENELKRREKAVAKKESELVSKTKRLDKELSDREKNLERQYAKKRTDLEKEFRSQVDAEVDFEVADRTRYLDDRERELNSRSKSIDDREKRLEQEIDAFKGMDEVKVKRRWNYVQQHFPKTAAQVEEAVTRIESNFNRAQRDLDLTTSDKDKVLSR